jgi:hypothetical protein
MTKRQARHLGAVITILAVGVVGKVGHVPGDVVLNAVLLLFVMYGVGLVAQVPSAPATGFGKGKPSAGTSPVDTSASKGTPTRGLLSSGTTVAEPSPQPLSADATADWRDLPPKSRKTH